MPTTKNKNNKVSLSFAAIDKVWQDNIVSPTEYEVKGKDYIAWGDRNDYPQYLFSLYETSTTLQAIINQLTTYINGDDVTTTNPLFNEKVNGKDETLFDLVGQIALSLLTYQGFAVNITRNRYGKIAELNVYYSTEWGKKYGRIHAIKYPKDNPDGTEPNSIFYYKNTTYSTYPTPLYAAATIAAETEKLVNEYHINSIQNGFAGGLIVGLNNGIPEDEQKAEIERNFVEKFCSPKNGGRVVLVYSNGGDNAPTLSEVKTDDFSEKYKALIENSRQQLYQSFGVHPVLLGNVINNGTFNSEDFNESWKLFSRTKIRNYQRIIVQSLKKIGVEITIKPFTIDWQEQEKKEEVK